MYSRLDDIIVARANMRKEHALKLRVVQHKYAAQVAVHARALERHARKLQRLHAKINKEAAAIAGADFADHHTLGFDEYESIAAQQADNEESLTARIKTGDGPGPKQSKRGQGQV